ncbi:MAG: mechanosensitive ion channel family protein [Acidimicrobiia bacterium]
MERLEEFWDTVTSNWGYELLASLAVVVGALILLWVVRKAVVRWTSRVERNYHTSDAQEQREQGQRLVTITSVTRVVISITVWVVVILTIMAIWGIPMAPLIAVGATVGIAVGFGAQDFVRDVIAGFLILVEDQYAIGDVVSIAGVSGSVEEVTLRTTVLRDLEGNRHHVPNGEIRVASNLTAGFSRLVVDVSVSYDTDLDRAIDVIADEALALSQDPDWQAMLLEEPVLLGVNKLGESGIDIRVLLTTTTEDRWAVKREFLKRMKQRLDTEQIEIPYQYLSVVMKDEGA